MNYERELCDLYDKNQEIAGKMMTDRYGKALVLLPVFHSMVAAQITVAISPEGDFLRAARVADEDKSTIIPVTEKSAVRTAGIEPHPLCDNLKYLAGDYMDHVKPEKGKDYTENHEKYMAALEVWKDSPYFHEKVSAVWHYLRKGTLIKDLITCGVLLADENQQLLPKEKIQIVNQADAFVRFSVEHSWSSETNILKEYDSYVPPECWKDISLQTAYIAYCRSLPQPRGLSYLTGEETAISYFHPKKIRNEGDGAKLISSNDDRYFTFRGRFATKEEAFAIGYEESQKMHNALKWIIRRQGKNWNGLCVVTWESDLKALPDWDRDTESVCETYAEWETWDDEEEKERYTGTNPKDAARFQQAIAGYGKHLTANSKMMLMAFDAATTGRLSMMQCQSLSTSSYLANLRSWHEDAGWLQPYNHKEKGPGWYYGIVSIKEMANLLYGSESQGMLSLKGSNEKMGAELCKRLIPCILLGRPLPLDLVRLAIQRASSPQSYQNEGNWRKMLSLACSFVRKKHIERKDKEEWTVALNKENRDRNYLYGRLLAVADYVEYMAQDRDEKRETNAKRFMTAFSQNPFRTWQVIEERMSPYADKLPIQTKLYCKHLLEEITWLFKDGDYDKADSLNGNYLLGFHNQAYALRNKTEEEK